MVDAFETSVKLKFVIPTGEVDRIKKLVEAATSTSFTKRLGGAASMLGGGGGAGAMMGKMALAGAAFGALVVSSPSLQGTLKALTNTVMLLIRPLGDILAVGLRPIIDILRPIGMFFRILIKPYLDRAKEAMKLGRQFGAKGEWGMAAESYALGAGYLLKPFFDMMVTVATISTQGVLAGIKLLGQGLIEILDPLNMFPSAASDFGASMDTMIANVGYGGAKIITDTSVMMDEWLGELKKGYDRIKDQANVGMGITAGFAGEGFVRIIQAAGNFLITTDSVKTQFNSMMDDIVNYGRTKAAELQAILHPGTTGGGGMTYTSYTSSSTPAGSLPAALLSAVQAAQVYLQTGMTQNPFNPSQWFGDFIWRPGSKPVQISPEDTIVGTKGGASKSVSVGDINIRIDKVNSNVDVRRLASEVRDEVINSLRMMT